MTEEEYAEFIDVQRRKGRDFVTMECRKLRRLLFGPWPNSMDLAESYAETARKAEESRRRRDFYRQWMVTERIGFQVLSPQALATIVSPA